MMIARMINNSGIPMRPICHLVLAGTAAIVPCLAAGLGDSAIHAQEPVAQFSSRVQLVEVYASVTDASGEPVMGLTRGDFEVYEDDQRQDISTFAAGEFPLAVALGVDRSWSMAGGPLRLARRAAEVF